MPITRKFHFPARLSIDIAAGAAGAAATVVVSAAGGASFVLHAATTSIHPSITILRIGDSSGKVKVCSHRQGANGPQTYRARCCTASRPDCVRNADSRRATVVDHSATRYYVEVDLVSAAQSCVLGEKVVRDAPFGRLRSLTVGHRLHLGRGDEPR